MSTPNTRRRFQFTLRTVFVVMTFCMTCVWLGSDAVGVWQRKTMSAWIESQGGHVVPCGESRASTLNALTTLIAAIMPRSSPKVPAKLTPLRKWLGDVAIDCIIVPPSASPTEAVRIEALFPESDIIKL